MGSITLFSKGRGLSTVIKLGLFILGEIYEAVSTTNQMGTEKSFLHPHSSSTTENIHLCFEIMLPLQFALHPD